MNRQIVRQRDKQLGGQVEEMLQKLICDDQPFQKTMSGGKPYFSVCSFKDKFEFNE